MSDLYSNDKIRERAERLVQNEVIYCVSSLVYSLSKLGEDVEKLDITYQELIDLQQMTNYDDAAEEYIDEMDRDDLISYLDDQGIDFKQDEEPKEGDGETVEGETIERLRELALKAAEEQGFKEFCEEFNVDLDDHRSEVYEHWIVSDYLAHKLEAKGHVVVRDFLGMTIWGRPTTGQVIAMDGVILEIANEMERGG